MMWIGRLNVICLDQVTVATWVCIQIDSSVLNCNVAYIWLTLEQALPSKGYKDPIRLQEVMVMLVP